MKNFEKYIDLIMDRLISPDCADSGYRKECETCPFKTDIAWNACILEHKCYGENLKQWLLAEYQEPLLSHDEYVILKNLPSWCKWIAKDKLHTMCTVYETKPKKMETFWNGYGQICGMDLFRNLFQFIKWEDDEPYEIEKLISDYEKEHGNEKD